MINKFVSKRGFKSILMKLKELSLGPSGIVLLAIRVHALMDSIFRLNWIWILQALGLTDSYWAFIFEILYV